MHEKALRLLARILPHLVAQWRLPRDLETLAALPDGRIFIDALEGTARHGSAGAIELALAAELRAGLESQLSKQGTSRDTIREAVVVIDSDTSRIRTDRRRIVHFDFRIASRIRAGFGEEENVYEGSQTEEHVWHAREAPGGWT